MASINNGNGDRERSKVEVDDMVDDGDEAINNEDHNEEYLGAEAQRLGVVTILDRTRNQIYFLHVLTPNLNICEAQLLVVHIDAHLVNFVIVS